MADPVLKKKLYPVVYMFIVTLVFASAVVGVTVHTRDRVEANARIAFERAVVEALPFDAEEDASPVKIHSVFLEYIKEPSSGSGGAYRLVRQGRTDAYAVPIAGQGFWDEIEGIIGFESDMETVTGISFHRQRETPGLGAEITKLAFRKQFEGLVVPEGKDLGLVQAGSEKGDSDVDAVTGATQTCTRLEKIINRGIGQWRKEMKKGASQ